MEDRKFTKRVMVNKSVGKGKKKARNRVESRWMGIKNPRTWEERGLFYLFILTFYPISLTVVFIFPHK